MLRRATLSPRGSVGQRRDVGGFVEEARRAVARDVRLPPGYYIGWSGRWENQQHARTCALSYERF